MKWAQFARLADRNSAGRQPQRRVRILPPPIIAIVEQSARAPLLFGIATVVESTATANSHSIAMQLRCGQFNDVPALR